jgi:hypothetical protein
MSFTPSDPAIGVTPDEVWCAAGYSVLIPGLARTWQRAWLSAVQVGWTLTLCEVAGARLHVRDRICHGAGGRVDAAAAWQSKL